MKTNKRSVIVAAKNLLVNDILTSSTGKKMKVSKVSIALNRTTVLFDGDLEIDFENYYQLKIERTLKDPAKVK